MTNNLIDKYKHIPATVKCSMWFTICSFFQKAVSLITIPIFTRMLTSSEFGITNIFNSWQTVISIFATLNLAGGVYTRGLLKYDQDEFTSAIQGLSTTISIFVLLVIVLFNDFFNKVTNLPFAMLMIIAVGNIFLPALEYWSLRQRFKYKYKSLVFITIFNTLFVSIIGIIFVSISTDRAYAKIISMAAASILVSLPFYFNTFKKNKNIFNIAIWKYALKFNLPLIPHYLSNLVLSQADRLMINSLCGASEAGLYSLAYSAAMVLTVLNDSINASFTPWRYQNMEKKEYKKISDISILLLVFIGTACVGVVCFAPEIITLLAPAEYINAIWSIPPVVLSVYFMFMYSMFSNVEFYFMDTKYMMYASVLIAILNIGLNYVMIPFFGYIVCGYTTLICYICFCVVHYLCAKKICIKNNIDYHILFNLKKIFIISVLLLLTTALFISLYNFVVIKYIIFIFFLLVVIIFRKKVKEIIFNVLYIIKAN